MTISGLTPFDKCSGGFIFFSHRQCLGKIKGRVSQCRSELKGTAPKFMFIINPDSNKESRGKLE
jgi:hypothetical protein